MLQILFLFILTFCPSQEGRCGVDLLPKMELITAPFIPSNRTRKLEESSGMEILIDFGQLNADLKDKQDYLNFVKKNLAATTQLFSSIFSIKTEKSKISLPSDLTQIGISQVENNQIISTEGVDYDLVIFPKINPTFAGSNVEAAAAPVVRDKNGRPLVGVVHLTDNYDIDKKNAEEYFQILLFHELSHVLGFNKEFYDKFLKTTNINGKERILITSSKVIEAAKRHFNCSNIPGVEVENQGGGGTVRNTINLSINK